MSNRKPISKKARFEIFKRDAFACQYCGAHPPDAILHVDHIDPVKLGGGNDPDNLITACSRCNLGKSATPLTSIPKSLADKAAETKEREAQIAGYAEIMESARARLEEDCWRVAEELSPGASQGYSRDKFAGVKRFVSTLGLHQTLYAAEVATARFGAGGSRTFRYFCGICWNRIRELEL